MSFVLIHGAAMAANCWDLEPLLDGDVLAVDCPDSTLTALDGAVERVNHISGQHGYELD